MTLPGPSIYLASELKATLDDTFLDAPADAPDDEEEDEVDGDKGLAPTLTCVRPCSQSFLPTDRLHSPNKSERTVPLASLCTAKNTEAQGRRKSFNQHCMAKQDGSCVVL